MSRGVTGLGGLEEAADAVGTLLQETQPTDNSAVQIIRAIMTRAAVGINNFCPQLAIKQENVHPTKIRVSS